MFNSLLNTLESYLNCPFCTRILTHPQTLPCCHTVCRLCLDQLLNSSQTCPACSACLTTPAVLDSTFDIQALLTSYYVIKRHGTLQRTRSACSDQTVDTVMDDEWLDPHGIMRELREAREGRKVMGGLENGSDTDSDLDLPDPDSFLSSPSNQSACREEIVLAPETPPATASKECVVAPETPSATTKDVVLAPETPPTTLCKDETVNTPKTTTKKAVRSTRLKRKSAGASSMTAVDLNSSITSDEPTAGPESSQKVVSTRPNTKRKKSVSDTLHVLTTGLTDAQTTRLRRAAKQVSTTGTTISIHTSATKSTHSYTHVVTPVGKDMRASRTFKYLVGLACGARVVTPDWLFECAKRNTVVSESPYAVKGDSATPTHTLERRNPGELFTGRSFYLWGEPSCWDAGSAHSRDDLVFLLQAAGARVVDELPEIEDGVDELSEIEDDAQDTESSEPLRAAKCMDKDLVKVPQKYRAQFALPASDNPIVLVDTNSLKSARCSTTMSAITATTLPCRTKSWLFDCISTNQIL